MVVVCRPINDVDVQAATNSKRKFGLRFVPPAVIRLVQKLNSAFQEIWNI